MADQPYRWYPPPGHNQDEVNRIAFDNLYTLLDMHNASASNANPVKGMSLTAQHPVPFSVGGNNFGSLIFKDGILVGVVPGNNNTSLPAGALVRNSGSSALPVPLAGGVPTVSSPVPPAPVVSALPGPTDPLSTPNQYVIYNGQPYIFTAGLNPGDPGYWALDVTGVPTIRDVWANLALYPAANYRLGTVFQATDWNVSYAVQFPGGVATWVYYNGIYEDVLANIPSALLGPRDRSLLFRASDYLHNWQWTGTVFSLFAAANNGFAGGLLPTTVMYNNGGPPFGGTGALWQACDGSTVPVSQENGTTANQTVPTIADGWFVR